jgi:tetratricopeptide (TPR) repeat protein
MGHKMSSYQRVVRIGTTVLSYVMLCCLPGLHVSAQVGVSPSESDAQIVAECRRQVEALPKEKQLVVGTEILRSALDKLKTKSWRQRLLVSLGDLHFEQGMLAESGRFYKEAIDVDSASELAVYSRLRVADLLKRSGKTEEADRIIDDLQPIRQRGRDGKTWLDENVVAAKVDAMIGRGRFQEAVDYCEKLSREYPASSHVLVSYAEKVPISLIAEAKHEEAIQWYEKIHKNFAAARTKSRFNCNYISALRYCDPKYDEKQLARLRRAIDEFAVNFPDDLNVPVFFATYADTLQNKGQHESAKVYYNKAIKHPKVSLQVKEAITRLGGTP